MGFSVPDTSGGPSCDSEGRPETTIKIPFKGKPPPEVTRHEDGRGGHGGREDPGGVYSWEHLAGSQHQRGARNTYLGIQK